MHPRDALYYAMTGDTFNGQKAAEIKFVNMSVPLATLKSETLKLAAKMTNKDRSRFARARTATATRWR